jgi:hypothetical protein
VATVSGDRLTLLAGRQEHDVEASAYTISVNASLVVEWRGAAVLRRLRATTGDLTASGKKNRHAVEDRFKLLGDSIRKLGGEIAVVGGGKIAIGSRAVSIRMEESR